MNNNNQDYYFKKDSDVLFVDEDNQAVGILNFNPQYTLDVNGSIRTTDITVENVYVDNIEGNNAYISTIGGDNATIDDINCVRLTATSNVSASNLISQSNLKLLNSWVNQECPIPNQGNVLGFSLGGGFIDPSWIKTDDDFGETLSALWDFAQTGWDIATFADNVLNPTNELGQGIKDAINSALSNGTLRVPWRSINYKPIYGSTTNTLGFDGDIYMNDKKSLYSLPSYNLSTVTNDSFSVDIVSTSGAIKVLDLETKNAWLKDISASNLTTRTVASTSNIQSPQFIASNIITSNMTITSNLEVTNVNTNNLIGGNVNVVSQLRVGDFYVNSTGLFLGDPSNPFLSKQVLNAQGDYVGTIDRNQLVNLEAFNMSALADGQLIFGSFGETNVLNDPFAQISTPLFNI